jgi:hypothetical protein
MSHHLEIPAGALTNPNLTFKLQIIYLVFLKYILESRNEFVKKVTNLNPGLSKIAGSRWQIAPNSTFCTLLLWTWPGAIHIVNVLWNHPSSKNFWEPCKSALGFLISWEKYRYGFFWLEKCGVTRGRKPRAEDGSILKNVVSPEAASRGRHHTSEDESILKNVVSPEAASRGRHHFWRWTHAKECGVTRGRKPRETSHFWRWIHIEECGVTRGRKPRETSHFWRWSHI